MWLTRCFSGTALLQTVHRERCVSNPALGYNTVHSLLRILLRKPIFLSASVQGFSYCYHPSLQPGSRSQETSCGWRWGGQWPRKAAPQVVWGLSAQGLLCYGRIRRPQFSPSWQPELIVLSGLLPSFSSVAPLPRSRRESFYGVLSMPYSSLPLSPLQKIPHCRGTKTLTLERARALISTRSSLITPPDQTAHALWGFITLFKT